MPSITPYKRLHPRSRLLSLPTGEGARRADKGKPESLISLAALASFPLGKPIVASSRGSIATAVISLNLVGIAESAIAYKSQGLLAFSLGKGDRMRWIRATLIFHDFSPRF